MPGYNQPAKTTNTRTIGTKKNKHRLSLASQWQVKPPRCLACESTRSWCLSHSPSFTRSSKPTPFQNVFRKLELFQVMRCKNERSELTSSQFHSTNQSLIQIDYLKKVKSAKSAELTAMQFISSTFNSSRFNLIFFHICKFNQSFIHPSFHSFSSNQNLGYDDKYIRICHAKVYVHHENFQHYCYSVS